ncbi:hypothetical protein GMOD_00009360 [Pyrenophora seminiperda CCB06]|uniref:Uncharacterized protein n=1 Tax=Pyrenophora seminiperda CCB06 TaxID=1302712 RepID=A0A3M7MGG8_9PLEO|nr:hypothetical protein GMOD_00009360 [Pyrenophora seminiperda CCB06]
MPGHVCIWWALTFAHGDCQQKKMRLHIQLKSVVERHNMYNHRDAAPASCVRRLLCVWLGKPQRDTSLICSGACTVHTVEHSWSYRIALLRQSCRVLGLGAVSAA